MWSADPRVTERIWMGGGGEEPDILRRRSQDIWAGSQVGLGCIFGNGGNVLQNGTGKKYLEDQCHGMHTRFHLGEVGRASVQVTGDGKMINVSRE